MRNFSDNLNVERTPGFELRVEANATSMRERAMVEFAEGAARAANYLPFPEDLSEHGQAGYKATNARGDTMLGNP